MKYLRYFCRGVGIAVVAMALLGAIAPGVNFRMCFGSSDRCQLANEIKPAPSQGTAQD